MDEVDRSHRRRRAADARRAPPSARATRSSLVGLELVERRTPARRRARRPPPRRGEARSAAPCPVHRSPTDAKAASAWRPTALCTPPAARTPPASTIVGRVRARDRAAPSTGAAVPRPRRRRRRREHPRARINPPARSSAGPSIARRSSPVRHRAKQHWFGPTRSANSTYGATRPKKSARSAISASDRRSGSQAASTRAAMTRASRPRSWPREDLLELVDGDDEALTRARSARAPLGASQPSLARA